MNQFIIMTAIICLCQAAPSTSFAITALEVKPQDVYRAAYCAELNRLSGFLDSDTTDPISLLAINLISSGDNLEFVEIAISDAKRKFLTTQQKSGLSSELQSCTTELQEILDSYTWMACGFGRGRESNADQAQNFLKELGLADFDIEAALATAGRNPYLQIELDKN